MNRAVSGASVMGPPGTGCSPPHTREELQEHQAWAVSWAWGQEQTHLLGLNKLCPLALARMPGPSLL